MQTSKKRSRGRRRAVSPGGAFSRSPNGIYRESTQVSEIDAINGMAVELGIPTPL